MSTDMIMRITRYLIFALVCLMPFPLFAQNVYGEFDPDYMFSDINVSFATTGFFLDKADEPVRLSNFDGQSLTDSNYVNRISLESIFNTIKDADLQGNRDWRRLEIGALPFNGYSLLVFDVALYEYNTLSESAIQNGIISFSNGRFITQNNSVSPFVSKYLFAGATDNSRITTTSVSFAINILPESNVSYSSIEIDPGDGGGFRVFSAPNVVNCIYTTEGYKEIILKATLPGGSVLFSHSLIYIQTEETFSPNYAGSTVCHYPYEPFSETYNGIEVSAKVQFDYHSASSQLEKPFIVVEGFDPVALGGILNHFNQGSTWKEGDFDDVLGCTYLYSDLINYIRSIDNDCDIVYVNWNNSEADIRANAKLLKTIINTVNSRKHAISSTNPNILMGRSMGGLVSRYALTDMESNNIDHEVISFISNDAPYHGASIPIGAMYAVRELIDYIDDNMQLFHLISFIEDAWLEIKGKLLQYFDGMSAKQMLYNYIDNTSNIVTTYYNNLQNELGQKGYPRGTATTPTTNIAFVNGGPLWMSDTLAYHNNRYLHADCQVVPSAISQMNLGFFANIISSQFSDNSGLWYMFLIPGTSEPRFHLDINADNGLNQQLMHFWGTYKKKVLQWTMEATLVDRFKTTRGLFSNLELTNGSYFNIGMISIDTPTNSIILALIRALIGALFIDLGDVTIDNSSIIMFVPTESALDTFVPNYSRNASSMSIIPRIDTPFDSYFVPDSGKAHIECDTSAVSILSYGLNNHISGNAIGETGDIYSAPSGLSGGIWGTSNDNIATIDSSGELTVIRSGTVDIHYIALKPGGNGYVCVKKRITAKADNEITSIRLYLQECLDNGNVFVKARPLTETDSLNWCAVISNDDLRETARYSWTKMVDWGVPRIYESGTLEDYWDEPYCYFPEVSIMPLLRDAQYNIYMSLRISDIVNNQSSTVAKMMQVQDLYDLLSQLFLFVCPDNLYWGDSNRIYSALNGTVLNIPADNSVAKVQILDERGVMITEIQNDHGIPLLTDTLLLNHLYNLLGESMTTFIECKVLDKNGNEIRSEKIPVIVRQSIIAE